MGIEHSLVSSEMLASVHTRLPATPRPIYMNYRNCNEVTITEYITGWFRGHDDQEFKMNFGIVEKAPAIHFDHKWVVLGRDFINKCGVALAVFSRLLLESNVPIDKMTDCF